MHTARSAWNVNCHNHHFNHKKSSSNMAEKSFKKTRSPQIFFCKWLRICQNECSKCNKSIVKSDTNSPQRVKFVDNIKCGLNIHCTQKRFQFVTLLFCVCQKRHFFGAAEAKVAGAGGGDLHPYRVQYISSHCVPACVCVSVNFNYF